MKKIFTWKKYHRWVGLVLSVFMLVFCVSGIILNHRSLFRGCEVSRSLLPASYHIKNFNNGIIKGTLSIGGDSVLAYGAGGVWLTDHQAKLWQDWNAGLPEGADNRNIRNMVKAKDGSIWMATQYDVYRWKGKGWKQIVLPDNDTRIADIALDKDSARVVILSRDAIFTMSARGNSYIGMREKLRRDIKITLSAPKDYKPTTTLFRTVWRLHSGEYFGLTGQLVVDAIAVVLIILSLTGIILFILPYGIRRQKRKGAKEMMKKMGKQMVWNQKWHNRFGYFTIVFTLWLAVSGMCLRPPFMIPLVMVKTEQKVDAENVWKDKLRAIRWDAAEQCWLISTSEGFLKVDENFKHAPVFFDKDKAPGISPMGITVFEKITPKDSLHQSGDEWLVGSFSGMYRWNPQTGKVVDYFTGKPEVQKSMRPLSNSLVSGYSKDFLGGKPVIFDYAKGVQMQKDNNQVIETVPIEMPEMLSDAKMSFWNVALELHVGRCYTPFLGPISDLFVFLSGLLISLILLSGYIILRRQKNRKKKSRIPSQPIENNR